MLTCKSPRKVLQTAWHLSHGHVPKYFNKFSRKDFTGPQLFACLVLREMMRLSYRGTEALLRDCEHWCRDIDMPKAPDHNTLWRAFDALKLGRRGRKLLDRLAGWFAIAKLLGDTLAIDATHLDTHHRSRHYEQRCRHYAEPGRKSADSKRRRTAKRMPKLAIGVDTRSHLVLSVRPRIGMSGDYPDFEPLLFDAWRRVPGKRLKTVLADAGYGSEANHRVARQDMGIRSLMPAASGPPTKRPQGRHRRRMKWELSGSQKGKPYGQRAQAETVMSMVKRNLGDSLRSRCDRRRRHEMILKVITHGVMLRKEGRDRAGRESSITITSKSENLMARETSAP